MTTSLILALLTLWIFCVPMWGDTVYAGTDRGLLSSSDSGRSWQQNQSLGPVKVRAVAVDPSNFARFLVATDRGFFRSADQGVTWQSTEFPSTGTVSAITFDSSQPGKVYAATGDTLWVSQDGGTSWRSWSMLRSGFVDLVVDPLEEFTLYAGSRDGVFRSLDSGSTWGLVLNRATHPSVVFAKGVKFLYAGRSDGVYRTSDNGQSWQMAVRKPAWEELGWAAGFTWSGDVEAFDPFVTDIDAFAIDPNNPDRMYLVATTCFDIGPGFCGAGVLSWMDGKWVARSLEEEPAALLIDSNGTVYLMGSRSIQRSFDGGRTWVRVQPVAATTPTITIISDQPNLTAVRNAADPRRPGPLAPGSVVSLHGTGLAKQPQQATYSSFGTRLEDTEVLVNGTPALLYYVSPTQINAVFPAGLTTGQATLQVNTSVGRTAIQFVSLAGCAPGIFAENGRGSGPGVLLHAVTRTPGSQTNPFRPGEEFLAYVTGLAPASELTAKIDGAAALVVEVAAAANSPGVFEVRVAVPAGVAAGMASFEVAMEGIRSNTVEVPLLP